MQDRQTDRQFLHKNRFNARLGFTLAEVLIILTIIGVVASLTIPNLITSTQNQKLHIAWKKTFNQISNGYLTFLNDNNGTGLGLGLDANISLLYPYFKAIKTCGWADRDECWHAAGESSNLDGTIIAGGGLSHGMILTDGTLITVGSTGWGVNCAGYNGACARWFIDVNGKTGPNIVGKDIYSLYLMRNYVAPTGLSWDNSWNWACIEPPTAGWNLPASNNYGYGCSKKYLLE